MNWTKRMQFHTMDDSRSRRCGRKMRTNILTYKRKFKFPYTPFRNDTIIFGEMYKLYYRNDIVERRSYLIVQKRINKYTELK